MTASIVQVAIPPGLLSAFTILANADLTVVSCGQKRSASHGIHQRGPEGEPELFVYRDRTLAMLRRYLRLSIQLGRLPSLVGREFFRARVTSYRVHTFEDSVIFAHDVERCLDLLSTLSQRLIARIVLEDYTQEEAAVLLGCTRRTVVNRFPLALDELTEIFLRRRLLQAFPSTGRSPTCQEPRSAVLHATDTVKTK